VRTLPVRTSRRSEMVEVTDRVREAVRASGIREGAVVVQSLHTTAGVAVNENGDPDVVHDFLGKLDRLFPREEAFYLHAEGNSDSHLKTSFVGPSVTLAVSGGDVVLGRWQGIWLCEFDGPRERELGVQVIAAAPPG
jgi:secondary thiamine-phosphate synthase enzyme